MTNRRPVLLPRYLRLLGRLGEQIKLARKRRKLTAIQVAERAEISRNTLYLVERGDPGVSIGNVLRVLAVLGLEDQLAEVAADDVVGRKLQDARLLNPKGTKKAKSDE